MVRIAILYTALFTVIIAVADANWLPQLAERIHHWPYCDKLLHFMLFGCLALVANLALASGGKRTLLRAIVIGSMAVLIVATVEEYSNQFVPVRDWSLGDLAANYLGVLCLGVLPLWQRAMAARGTTAAGVEPVPSPGAR